MTKKNKKITIAIITLLVITAIGVTMAVSHYSKPDFTKMTPQQIRQYFDSNQFRDANEDKRQEMREQMGEAMMARAAAQANEYANLSADEKTVYLDKIIDDMEARRAARDANDANGPDPNRFARFGPADANRPRFGQRGANMGQRPRVNTERRRERSSRISADTSVKMMQFRQDLMNRMQERGVTPGRGGFGGGFGGPPPGGR